ncbi:MAG TPA: hypothetical protein VFK82_06340 [Burkholderiaceae bacterium]|nr:hypothetical protein [Burkholderiaceae bacterium]
MNPTPSLGACQADGDETALLTRLADAALDYVAGHPYSPSRAPPATHTQRATAATRMPGLAAPRTSPQSTTRSSGVRIRASIKRR